MKRVLVLSLTLLFALCGVAYAVGVNGQYNGNDIVQVTYEGSEVTPSDVPAQLIDGRTLIPLDMLRSVGFTVEWDSETLTANITQRKKSPQSVKTLDQVKAMSDRIALIYALENGVRKEQGSGFLISSNGLLITAAHVLTENGLDRALEVHVRGKTYNIPEGATAFRDEKNDIAGIYLYDKDPFPYFKVGELPKVNDKVYGLGYPQGVLESQESWVFSVFDYNIGDYELKGAGFSGGALLNIYGEVVSVVTRSGVMNTDSTPMGKVIDAYRNSFNQ